MVDTVFSAEWSAATRWMARLRIMRDFLSASAFARASASRMMAADYTYIYFRLSSSSAFASSGVMPATCSSRRLISRSAASRSRSRRSICPCRDDIWCSRASSDSTRRSSDSSRCDTRFSRRTHFAQALLAFGFGLLLVLQRLVLGFYERLAAQRLGLFPCVGNHAFGFLRGLLGTRIDQKPGDDKAESDADDCSDDEP